MGGGTIIRVLRMVNCEDRGDPSHVPWLGMCCLLFGLFSFVYSDGSLLFCCLVVSCVFAYVMHGPNVMSSLFRD